MDTARLLTGTNSDKAHAFKYMIFNQEKTDKQIAEQIFYCGALTIVNKSAICWPCPHVAQIKQFEYDQYVFEMVYRNTITIKGCIKSRATRVYLFEISDVQGDHLYYDKVKGQRSGITPAKTNRVSIGYLTHMVSLIRKELGGTS